MNQGLAYLYLFPIMTTPTSRTTHQKKSVHERSIVQNDQGHKQTDSICRAISQANNKTLDSSQVHHTSTSDSLSDIHPNNASLGLKRKASGLSLKGKAATTAAPDGGISASSLLSKEPSLPVLVNPPAIAMRLPMSSNPLYKFQTRTKRSLEQSPSPASFSINSILHSLQADDVTQIDVESSIEGIAQIYARNNLSLSNSYGFHRTPIGSGPDLDDETEEEDNRLTLDTNAAIQHTSNLETVEELPTPLSGHSRKGSDLPDLLDPKIVSPPKPFNNSITDSGDDGPLQPLAVWQIRARQGRTTSRSVSGLSIGIEARGNTESFTVEDHPDLRHDVSGNASSRAIRQLQRVAGK